MKLHPKYNLEYETWRINIGGWGRADHDELMAYKRQRRPLPPELLNKRREHMIKLYEDGTPYSWIARLYRIDRAQARRIINNLPNH